MLVVRGSAHTERGTRHVNNEDSCSVSDELGVYAVSDGLGGQPHGDEASLLAARAIGRFFRDTQSSAHELPYRADPRLSPLGNRVLGAMRDANRTLLETAEERPAYREMAATILVLATDATSGQACIGHLGDSRAYRLRHGSLQQLTEDHTPATDRLFRGRSDEQLGRGLVTRVLGMQALPVFGLWFDEIQPGERFLLCSDGLSSILSSHLLTQLLQDHDEPDAACRALVAAAKRYGGTDDVTALVVSVADHAHVVSRSV